MTKNTTTNAAGATQPVYQVVTQWIAEDGTQYTGSDDRIVSEHDSFAAAQLALAKTEIRHPHNHAEIIEVAGPATQGQMFKVTIAKKTGAGWDQDYASGQLEHMASYHVEKSEADAEADRKNAKLAQEMADGLGMDIKEYEESGRAAECEKYYHVVTA